MNLLKMLVSLILASSCLKAILNDISRDIWAEAQNNNYKNHTKKQPN